MKISMIIPCKWDHVKYLEEALDNVLMGSRIPDEVFVFVTPVADNQKEILAKIFDKYEKQFSFFKIFQDSRPYEYAEAKNMMTMNCTGDIVICHDADDIQHIDRVKLIHIFFDNNDIVHLNHSFIYYDEEWETWEHYDRWESQELYDSMIKKTGPEGHFGAYGHPFCRRTMDGSMAFRREVFEKVQWATTRPKGMDKQFCFDLLREFNKSLLVDIPLYKWRKQH